MKNEEIKRKIIENKIILEKDWPNLEDAHVSLAKIMLDFSESGLDNEPMSEIEQEQFKKEFLEIQDKIDLESLLEVKNSEEKEKDMTSVSFKMPPSFIRFIRKKIFPLMIEDLKS